MLRTILALSLACIVSAAAAQDTQRYALVVGASAYRSPIRPLLGPRNDVTLLVNTLIAQGVSRDHIRVLADGLNAADYQAKVQADGAPTRAAIMEGLDWLAQNAGPNSEVLIFFAGHGSQFPSADEPDGLNEFFLPVDARRSTTAGQPPANILLDDDLQPKLAAILNRGAFVWFVADACHSGSLSRAAETDRTARFVTPEDLGATREMIASARAAALARGNTEVRARGAIEINEGARFVGFYAAQPEQVTYESAAPKSLPGSQRRMHGEFTWSLVNAIRANRFDSYSSIARRMLAQYWEGHSDVVPYFEGALQMRPMLGAGSDSVVQVLARNRQLYIRAGAIDGVGDGAVVALVDLSSETNPVLGRGVVASGAMTESRMDVVARTDPGGLIERARNEGGPQAARLGARIMQRSAEFVVHVAAPRLLAPDSATSNDRALLALASQALQTIADLPPIQQPVAIETVPPDGLADFYLVVSNNRLWFLARGETLDLNSETPPFSLTANSVSQTTIGRTLRVLGRARNLLRVTRVSMEAPVSRNLSAEVYVMPGQAQPDGSCPVHDATERLALPADARRVDTTLSAPTIENCSIVFVKVHNLGIDPLDVTPLYVDPWSQICFLGTYENAAYEGMRLNPDQTRIVSYTEEVPTRDGARGLMNLLFIASVSSSQGPARDYRYLAACGELDSVELAQRDAGASGFAGLLHRAGFANGQNRAAPVDPDFSGGAIAVPLVTHRAE